MNKSKLKFIEVISGKNIQVEAFYYNELKKELDVIVTLAVLMGHNIEVEDIKLDRPLMIARRTIITIGRKDWRNRGICLELIHDIQNKLVAVEISGDKGVWRTKQNSHVGLLFHIPKIKELL